VPESRISSKRRTRVGNSLSRISIDAARVLESSTAMPDTPSALARPPYAEPIGSYCTKFPPCGRRPVIEIPPTPPLPAMRRAGTNPLSATNIASTIAVHVAIYVQHGAGKYGSTTEPLRNVVSTTRATPALFGNDGSIIAISA
jgi:hypothetical protein